MPAQGPPSLPGYGAPYVGIPVYGQLVSAPTTRTADLTRSKTGQTNPAYRVTVVADEAQEPQAQQNAVLSPETGKDSKCKSGDCGPKSCGHVEECCCFPYAFRVYGEYLYLRARDSEVCYAVETNSASPPVGQRDAVVPVQTSPIAVLDQDYSSGFRAGFGICLDACSEIGASYTWFDTSAEHSISSAGHYPQQAIAEMVLHPATPNGIVWTVEAAGRHDIGFELIDIDYRNSMVRSCTSHLDYIIGVRWGKLEQEFDARFTHDLKQPDNRYEVATDIDFDGAGVRLGLEGERYYCRVPVKLYMKGFASLLAGEFDATYQQTVQNNAYPGVNTGWTAGRIVPTFDLELGGGFYLPGGKLEATVGYVFSAWTNVVKTEDWIHAVQTNDFRDMGDSMTFDGIVARVEGRF